MISLPLANILHHKLRSTLCASAVGVGIAMLIVQLSLSHGMLQEVANRMQSVDAELIVLPKHANVIFQGGAIFSDGYVEHLESATLDGRRLVAQAIPVFLETVPLGGQQQRVFGIDPEHMAAFLASRKLCAGDLFRGGAAFKRELDTLRGARRRYDPERVTEEMLAPACELVIDSRLARAGKYAVGDTTTLFGRDFTIVGIVEAGVAGRVFAPLQTLRHILNGGVPWSSMFFVKLVDPEQAERAADLLSSLTGAKVELKSRYGHMLKKSFTQVYLYLNAASATALVVCFLFIMMTMYTLVLEQTRDIGILKSLGASKRRLVFNTVAESVMLCFAGTLIGVALSFLAKALIEALLPLNTVTIEWRWLGLAVLVGIGGGALSAAFPGYRAARLDPAAALSYE
ncbi:MAG: ABC transporter permease [bacterium]|nr:ABC transporter permease [bacterium]